MKYLVLFFLVACTSKPPVYEKVVREYRPISSEASFSKIEEPKVEEDISYTSPRVEVKQKIVFQELYDFAVMASIAEEQNPFIKSAYSGAILRDLGQSRGKLFIVTDSYYKTQTIVIKCTGIISLLKDSSLYKRSGSELNASFHQGLEDRAYEAHKIVVPLIRKGYKTYIVGHATGGGAAVILMAYLKRDGFSIEKVVTFGQPRVTNRIGVDFYKDFPLVRVVLKSDVVPLLPLGSTYKHFGFEVFLDGDNYILLTGGSTQLKDSCSLDQNPMFKYLTNLRNKKYAFPDTIETK